jgi:hypothetical protein
MSDHEFERQVQQKMDELKFSPSANVWKGIELDLDKDRKRRRGLFWWPAALLVLLAGGYLFYSGGASNPSVVTKNQDLQDLKDSQDGRDAAINEATHTVKEKGVTPGASEQESSTVAEYPTSKVVTGSSKSLTKQATSTSLIAQGHINNTNSQQPVLTSSEDQSSEWMASNSSNTYSRREQLSTLFPSLMPGTSPFVNDKLPSAKQQSVTSGLQGRFVCLTATKQSRWSYGVTAGVNMSGVNEGGAFNFNRASVVDLSGGIANSSFLPANTVIYKASTIKPGVGFSLGGYAQRSLNKRFDLSLGLGFTRFNSSIMVGEKQFTPIAINGPSSTARMANPYYTRDAENEYKMHMDFVEVPVNIAYKFNPSSKLPVSVNAGLVGGRLVGSNALHFDGSSAGYFKNNELLKKWQLGVNAGIALSIMNKSKHPVTVGPSFRYQMTNSLSNEVGAKRNIIGVGVDARIKLGSFGKK